MPLYELFTVNLLYCIAKHGILLGASRKMVLQASMSSKNPNALNNTDIESNSDYII